MFLCYYCLSFHLSPTFYDFVFTAGPGCQILLRKKVVPQVPSAQAVPGSQSFWLMLTLTLKPCTSASRETPRAFVIVTHDFLPF